MANVLIRDVPDEIINELKQMAKLHNRPLQQELREILVSDPRHLGGALTASKADDFHHR